MTTSDPEKDLLATVLSEYAVKASAFPQDQQLSHRFELVGSIWHLRYGKEEGDFPKSSFRGMAFIAKLLGSPYVPILASALDDQDRRSSTIRPARELDNTDAVQVDPSFQGMIDHDALLEYGARLQEIKEELAKPSTSVAEREQLVKERDAIAKAIKASRGLGGRARELGSSPAARAVGRVRKALAAAYDAIEKARMPEMARYLSTAIERKKTHFAYLPKAPAPRWHIKTF